MNSITPEQRFNYAVNVILQHEGNFSNDANDSGGATNYGISLRFIKEEGIEINHDGIIDVNDIKDMRQTDAINIYKKYWWDKYHYEAINSLSIASKIFDMAVDIGSTQAHKIAQESCNYCGHNLVVDGILGGKTIGALNEISLHGREQDLMDELIYNHTWFYENLAEEHPKLKVFLKGWLNRAAWNPDDRV